MSQSVAAQTERRRNCDYSLNHKNAHIIQKKEDIVSKLHGTVQTDSLFHTLRLLKSSRPGKRPSLAALDRLFSFRFNFCSNCPLLLIRFVGVPSYSLPLYPLLDWFSSSVSTVVSDLMSSRASRLRFCAVLGVSIKRRNLLSCNLRFTSAVTSMCSTT